VAAFPTATERTVTSIEISREPDEGSLDLQCNVLVAN
jgi:hypothetical protein